jgi:predicted aspartyl protease
MDGSFDESGSPSIELDVFGWNEGVTRRVTAVVDTGFTGFLMLPLFLAFPVGLILHATVDITLADGSTHSKLNCWGGIQFNGQHRSEVILVEGQGTEVLVGLQFLSAFNLVLTLDVTGNRFSLEQAVA